MKIRPLPLSVLLIALCAAGLLLVETARQRRDLSVRGMLLRLPWQEEGVQVFVDTQTLRRAGLLEMLAGSRASEELDYRRFVEAVQFDYREDLDVICGVLAGARSNFILKGRLSWADIRAYAERHGAQCRAGYCGLEGRSPDRFLSFYPISEDVLSIGIDEDIWAAAGTRKQHAEPAGFWIPPQPFWVAVPGKVLADPGELPPGISAFVSQVKGAKRMTLAIGAAGDSYEAEMRARFDTDADAAASRENLERSTGMLRSFLNRENQTPGPDDLSRLLVSGVFEQKGTEVIGRWPITRGFLEKLSAGTL
ncbi:MAG: hypothetical protein R2762_28785 [Bryobacteraceae bacterium]